MRLLALVLLLLCVTASTAFAQATPASRLGWTMNETDAQTMTYWLSVDGGARTQVQNVTCVPMAPPAHDCDGDLPPLTVGQHDLDLLARRTVDGTDFDSLPSSPLSITFAALPSSPVGLRLINDSD